MSNYGGLNITIFVDPLFIDQESTAMINHLLYLSGDTLFFWYDGSNLDEFLEKSQYSDSLIISGYGFPGFNCEFPGEIKEELKRFVSEGGQLVTIPNIANPMNNWFGTYTSKLMFVFQEYIQYGSNLLNFINDDFLNVQGFDFASNYANSKFSSVYQPNRILPYLASISDNIIDPTTVIRDRFYEFNYCPYTWPYFKYFNDGAIDYYCSVWSKSYGLVHISILSNSFRDVGTGFKSTYLQEEPWVRVLHIALDPNYGTGSSTRSPVVSPSASPTPTQEENLLLMILLFFSTQKLRCTKIFILEKVLLKNHHSVSDLLLL